MCCSFEEALDCPQKELKFIDLAAVVELAIAVEEGSVDIISETSDAAIVKLIVLADSGATVMGPVVKDSVAEVEGFVAVQHTVIQLSSVAGAIRLNVYICRIGEGLPMLLHCPHPDNLLATYCRSI